MVTLDVRGASYSDDQQLALALDRHWADTPVMALHRAATVGVSDMLREGDQATGALILLGWACIVSPARCNLLLNIERIWIMLRARREPFGWSTPPLCSMTFSNPPDVVRPFVQQTLTKITLRGTYDHSTGMTSFMMSDAHTDNLVLLCKSLTDDLVADKWNHIRPPGRPSSTASARRSRFERFDFHPQRLT